MVKRSAIARCPRRMIRLILQPLTRLVRVLLGRLRRELGLGLARADKPVQEPKPSRESRWVQVEAGPARGANLRLDESGAVNRQMIQGCYDSFIYDSLEEAQVDLAGATAWDVGAHVGYHTLALASLVGPTGRVVAFEPNPHNLQRLRCHLKENSLLAGRVELHTEALSNVDGQQSFRYSPRFSSRGYLDLHGPPSDRFGRTHYEHYESMSIAVMRADSIVKAGVSPPSLIKIDVEGAELEVLEGAIELLNVYRPVLAIEIHNITSMFHVQGLLFEYGYDLRLLTSASRSSSRAFILGSPTANLH